MKIIIMLLLGALLALLVVTTSKKHGKNALYLFAIGSIINASIFQFMNFSVSEYNITFGTNFVLANVFFWCIFITTQIFSKKDAITLVVISGISLLFSIGIQFLTQIMTYGYQTIYLKDLSTYFISLAGFVVGSIFLIEIFKNIKTKEKLSFLKIYFSLTFSSMLYLLTFYMGINLFWQFSNPIIIAYYFVYTVFVNSLFVLYYKKYEK